MLYRALGRLPRLKKRHNYQRAIEALLDGVWRVATNGSHDCSKGPCRQGSDPWSDLPSRHGYNEPQANGTWVSSMESSGAVLGYSSISSRYPICLA